MKIKDQIGRIIELQKKPRNIISLVPSITYTLSSFGLDKEVKGITRFCKYPEHWKKEKKIIGGTKNLKIDRIKEIAPDLIFANKEENTKEEIDELSRHFNVFVSDVKNAETNIQFIRQTSILLNKEEQAKELIDKIILEKNKLGNQIQGTVAYFIWKDPWMSIGSDTYIHSMLEEFGLKNIFFSKKRYPVVNLEKLKGNPPEYIFLSSEPYPFKENHKKELENIFPESKIVLVQGEAFTWFGTYQEESYRYFQKLKKELFYA